MKVIRYSSPQRDEEISRSQVLLVDRVGILANLYAWSQIAFVGGSFGPGVHNVLEPAASANVVLFGPKILNSPEAQELVRRGAGFIVQDEEALWSTLKKLLDNPSELETLRQKAREFIQENKGATDRILRKIQEVLQSV